MFPRSPSPSHLPLIYQDPEEIKAPQGRTPSHSISIRLKNTMIERPSTQVAQARNSSVVMENKKP